jgi:hypothetical protein
MQQNSVQYFMAMDFNTRENIWSYRDEPGTKPFCAALGVLVISFLLMIAFSRSVEPAWPVILVVAVIIAVVVSRLTRTAIEINRRDGTVTKTDGFSFFKKQKTFQLGMFDNVILIGKNLTVEEGYGITCYSVVLEGGDVLLELLSTDDLQKGRAIRKELLEFLEMSKEQK